MTFKQVRDRAQKQWDAKRRAIYKKKGLDYDKTLASARSKQKRSQSSDKEVPVIESTRYEVETKSSKGDVVGTEQVSRTEYERIVKEQERKGEEFSTRKRVSSSGLTTGKKYDPKTGKYYDVNPVTGVRQLEVKKYDIGGRSVSKEEYDKYIKKKLRAGKTLEVSTSRPGVITGKEPTAVEDKGYWDWKKKLAEKYISEHPTMPTTEYFTPIKDKEGKIVGYSDVIGKKSVMLKEGESVTEKSLKTASMYASALINIEKDKEPTRYFSSDTGTYTATPKQPFSTKLSTTLLKLEQRTKASSSSLIRTGGPTVAFIGSTAKTVFIDLPIIAGMITKGFTHDVPQAGVRFGLLSPRERVERVESGIEGFIPGVSLTTASIIQSQLSKAIDSPAVFAGEVTGSIIAPTVWSRIISTATKIGTKVLAKTGLKYVEPSDVFSPQSLAHEGKLPRTESTAETIKAFKETAKTVDKIDDVTIKGAGYSEVIPEEQLTAAHISPAEFGKSGQFGSGPAGEAGVQDPGLFVSSGGHLSPLRIGDGSSAPAEYSFNPVKWLESFKGGQTGKGYFIKFKLIDKIPEEVLASPGFEDDLAKFYYSQKGKETAYVSKRSMIGHGEINPQRYTASKTFELKGKTTVEGAKLFERGTVEEEAVFGEGTLYQFGSARDTVIKKLLKAEEYTKYGDHLVLLTRGRVLPSDSSTASDVVSAVASKSYSSPGVEMLSARGISSVVYINPKTIYVDPVSSSAILLGSSLGVSVSSAPSSYEQVVSPVISPETSKVSSKKDVVSSVSVSSNVASGSSSPVSSNVASGSGYSSRTSKKPVSSNSVVTSDPHTSMSGKSISSVSSSPISSVGSSISTTPNYINSFVDGPPPRPSYLKFRREKKGFVQLFSPQVRKRGRWVDVSPGVGYSKEEALQKGLFVVGHSARASTRIVSASSGIKKERFFGRGILSDFYKKGSIYIEKRARRIKSRGELEEITVKGQRAIKSKSIMKKFKLWG